MVEYGGLWDGEVEGRVIVGKDVVKKGKKPHLGL